MKYIILLLLAFTLFGCTKDRLENETSVFVGTWTWAQSVKYIDNTGATEIIQSADQADSYSLKFEEKGKVSYQKNGSDEEKYRVVFNQFKSEQFVFSTGFFYEILLNNKLDHTLTGYVATDSLITSDTNIPFSQGAEEYPYYEHLYIKN